MKKTLSISLLLLVSFCLNSITIILKNDKQLSGNFINMKKDQVYIEHNDNLYTISTHIISFIMDNNQMQDLNYLESLDQNKINYNKYLKMFDLDLNNYQFSTYGWRRFSQNPLTLILKDSSRFSGYFAGKKDSDIYFEQLNSNKILILKDVMIAAIVDNNTDVTDDILNSLTEPEPHYFYADTQKISLDYSKNNEYSASSEYPASTGSVHADEPNIINTPYLFVGCDIGLVHRLSYQGYHKSYNIQPSPYLKLETIGNNNVGLGLNAQLFRSLSDYTRAQFFYFCGYFTCALKLDTANTFCAKANVGGNLFLGNDSYKGPTSTKPGFYLAAGFTKEFSRFGTVEVMYTFNNGALEVITVNTHSISVGLGRKF